MKKKVRREGVRQGGRKEGGNRVEHTMISGIIIWERRWKKESIGMKVESSSE